MASIDWTNSYIKEEKTYLLGIIQELEAYKDYKFVKSRNALTYRDKFHKKEMRLSMRMSLDNESNIGLEVYPSFSIRIHEVHKWFEKFYQGSNIKDFRQHSTLSMHPNHPSELLGLKQEKNRYFFRKDQQENWAEELAALKYSLCVIGITFFDKCADLTSIYYNYTRQLPTNKKLVIGVGKWIFEQLYIVKRVCPEEYPAFLKFAKEWQESNQKNNEPNAMIYAPYFDKILNELEKMQ